MRLVEKVKVGSKVTKRYDESKTPYQMLLESQDVDELTKRKLKRQYPKLNPAKLIREINSIQRKLFKRSEFKTAKEARKAEQEAICLG